MMKYVFAYLVLWVRTSHNPTVPTPWLSATLAIDRFDPRYWGSADVAVCCGHASRSHARTDAAKPTATNHSNLGTRSETDATLSGSNCEEARARNSLSGASYST